VVSAVHARGWRRPVLVVLVSVQGLAMAVGSGSATYALPLDDAWHRNAFVAAAAEFPSVWVLVVVVPALALVVRHLVRDVSVGAGNGAATIHP